MNSITQLNQGSLIKHNNKRVSNNKTTRIRIVTSASQKSTTNLTERITLAERLNGRLAMLGFVSGTGNELITQMSYTDQLTTNWLVVVALSGFIGFATLKTRNVEIMDDKKPFTSDIEVLNGRMAMLGILMKLFYENTM